MRVAVSLLLIATVAACRPGSAASQRSGGGDAASPADPADAVPTRAVRCAGGRAWDGTPSDCAYEHDGCCYATAELACAAESCDAAACEVLETYPAQVRCRGR